MENLIKIFGIFLSGLLGYCIGLLFELKRDVKELKQLLKNKSVMNKIDYIPFCGERPKK